MAGSGAAWALRLAPRSVWHPRRLGELAVTPQGITISRPWWAWWRVRSVRWTRTTGCDLAIKIKVRRKASGQVRLRNVYVLTVRRRFGFRKRLRMATPTTVTDHRDFVTAGPDWSEDAEHVRRAAQAIAVSFARFHLVSVLEHLRDGADVGFGVFTATPAGLRYPSREVTPWSKVYSADTVGSVNLTSLRPSREMFSIHAERGAFSGGIQTEYRSKVHNHTTLSLLIEVLKDGASFSRAQQALADVRQPPDGTGRPWG